MQSFFVFGVGKLRQMHGPGVGHSAYSGATPGLLTRTWFPTLNPNIGILSERTSSSSQIGSSVKVED